MSVAKRPREEEEGVDPAVAAASAARLVMKEEREALPIFSGERKTKQTRF